MSTFDPFANVPKNTDDLARLKANAPSNDDLELNIVQSAHIQNLLRLGQVTPEQVTEWKRKNGLTEHPLPASVAVPAQAGLHGGRTQPDAPFQSQVALRSFELTPEQRQNVTQAFSDAAGHVRQINAGDTGSTVTETA